ncbi:MAG: hypothetical protein AAB552_04105 [Patescibacteria group bacterium]
MVTKIDDVKLKMQAAIKMAKDLVEENSLTPEKGITTTLLAIAIYRDLCTEQLPK